MKLPMPVIISDKKYTEVELKEASAEIVANVVKDVDRGAFYDALLTWCVGVIDYFVTDNDEQISDKSEVRQIARSLPFLSAYAVTMYGMAKTQNKDEIRGKYLCPDCGTAVFVNDDTGLDSLSELEILYIDDPKPIEIKLSTPVKIYDKSDKLLYEIESITMNYPTLKDCIKGFSQYPDDTGRMQFATYSEALATVNGQVQTPAWHATFGVMLFGKMRFRDIDTIGTSISKYGVVTTRERVCPKCFSHWDAEVDLYAFFGSGLKGKSRGQQHSLGRFGA
jgi:hypothetical protein